MKKIIIKFQEENVEINVTKITAFPNNVFMVNYSNENVLTKIIQPPIYIIEKDEMFEFQHPINSNHIDLLFSISQGIENNYSIF
jgi:hypothetical protein